MMTQVRRDQQLLQTSKRPDSRVNGWPSKAFPFLRVTHQTVSVKYLGRVISQDCHIYGASRYGVKNDACKSFI